VKHTKDLHRIDPATVRAEVEAAGFVLEVESAALARADDPRNANVVDPAIRSQTDQFILRFRKPERPIPLTPPDGERVLRGLSDDCTLTFPS